MNVKEYIWIEDDKYSWVPGKITSNADGQYKVEIEIDGEIESRFVPSSGTYSEVHLSCLKGVDDLLMLGDFNQQALLHNTRQRFASDKIYSFIGLPILIAVNPYKPLDIYNDKTIKSYKDHFNKLKNDPKEAGPSIPHLYHLSEAAYRDMINDKKNQSIIISGESGSGKTESTKIILKYLAVSSLSTSSTGKNEKGEVITVEKQVLDSNPLLEAFGNAKTLKNNNSSRFGKFIQVSFTENGKILSARIYNYLLEKSRVVSIQKEERNYHIFYQLLLGADQQEQTAYRIPENPLEYFEFLKHGSFSNDDTNDEKDFKVTKNCMRNCDFNQNEINYILSILIGILYLGNVEFDETNENNNSIAIINEEKEEDLKNAAHFLGLSRQTLVDILTTRKLVDPMTKKALVRYLSVDRAYNARDAIAKALYAKMFDFIVAKVNRAISNKEASTKYDKNKLKKIGLLDIFGFENFEANSFEQLCINYANERLQQYFNNHIFKLEQEEYSKEGIGWGKINFLDNNDIISLIDGNQLSIFSLLDSEGITPNANDKSFRNNVYKHCKKSEALGDETDHNMIVINHFAGVIEYVVDGFVEKNLDQLTSDITEALAQSSNNLIKKVFESKEDAKGKGKKTSVKPNKLQSDTLSRQFKNQLDELLTMLSQSNPRYVKCIKPNSLKRPQVLDSLDVMDQLLCAGILEAIKIRKKGYSIRRTKEEFFKFYKQLTPQVDLKNSKDINEVITKMIGLLTAIPEIKEAIRPDVLKLQVGHTKIFMKEEIKVILDYKMNRIKYIYLIQSCTRAMEVRKKVRKIFNCIKLIQATYRCRLMKEFYRYLKSKVRKIQKSVRHFRLKKRVRMLIKKLEMNRLIKQKEEEERLRKEREEYAKLHNIPIKEPEQIAVASAVINGVRKEKPKSSLVDDDLPSNAFIQQMNPLKNAVPQGKGRKNHKPTTEDSKETKDKAPKKSKKTTTSQNIFDFSVQNVVDEELKKKVDSLQKELTQAKSENDTLKTENDSLKQELLEAKEKLSTAKDSSTFDTSYTTQAQASNEVKSLKKSLNEKDSSLEILTMQLDQLTKANKSIAEQFDSFKSQSNKRKEKYDKEVNALYQQIQELEIAKNEYERRLTQETKEQRDSHALINLNTNQRVIAELKAENKAIQKKFDELKAKHSKEITAIKSEVAVKEYQLKSSAEVPEDYKLLKKENELCKEKVAEMKVKLENMNKLSKQGESRGEFEVKLHQKEAELMAAKEECDKAKAQVDKLRRMDTVLRTELEEKERKETEHLKEIEDVREENEKLSDDVMALKRENNAMKTKIGIFDAQAKARSENEVKGYLKQIETYKKQVSDNESTIAQLEESVEKKQNVLDNVKKMNLLLIELAKIKKSEVHFIDGLKLTNSSQLKEALESLREKESTILSQLAEVSKEQVESDEDDNDEDDDNDNDEEEEEEEEGEADGDDD